jgi:glycosyltransferase involved in cell wall biosynthesis
MKVLNICGDYDKFHQNLINKQLDLGITARVYYYTTRRKKMNQPSEKFLDFYNSNIRILRGPLFFRSRINNVSNNFLNLYQRHFDYDIIHSHMWFSDGEIAHKVYERLGIPYIIAVRNTDMNSWFYWDLPWNKKRGYQILRNAARVVFLSHSYKSSLIQRLPKDLGKELEKKALIVPNGIDDYWHENVKMVPKQKPVSVIKILTVGSIDSNKNQMTVLKAANLLRMKGYNIEYTVVGNVSDKKVEKELLQTKYVKILPFSSMEKLKEIYNNADIFVMPSIYETFGLVYVEAMSQGLPVIYSKGQGFDKQFPEGEIGFSVNCMNAIEISEKILKVLDNYSTISSNCIKSSKIFDNKLIAERYLNIYKSIVTNQNES